MKFIVLSLAVLASFKESTSQIISATPVPGGVVGQASTTRYWDCCKPSCGWVENTHTGSAVATCAANGVSLVSPSVQSGCIGGQAFMCSNEEPRAINDTFALGFAAASFTGGVDNNLCCACFLLTFGGGLEGKQMILQNTNTGSDLNSFHFDISIPGGGVGYFSEGCTRQWGAPYNGWGDQYGGVHTEAECSQLPSVLQDGCRFRFTWMRGVSNPPASIRQVVCPSQLVSVSGCSR